MKQDEETTEGLMPFINRTKDLPVSSRTKVDYEVVMPMPVEIHEMMHEISTMALNHHQVLSMIDQRIRDGVVPPIKGKVTAGKVRWRGLYIVESTDKKTRYVAQRGRKIIDLPTFGIL